MHPSARMFALRAAAKVTLSLGAVSCGAMVDEVKPDVVPASDTKDAATAFDAPPVVGNACSATNVSLDAGASRAVFDCCLPVVEGALPDAGWSSTFSPEKASDPSVLACCHEIIAHLEDHGDAATMDVDAYGRASSRGALQACCSTLKAFSTTTCTPWGPPAPPPFVEEVA